MKIIDITLPIRPGMPVYPGDISVEITPIGRISEGASSNLSALKLGTHTGTHVDPPIHMIEGAPTLDSVSLDMLIGECYVCDVGDVPVVDLSVLQASEIPENTTRLLLKTRNSDFWYEEEFRTDFTYLAPDAAQWLVERGTRLIGTDYLSIEKFRCKGHPTHLTLLSAGIVIIEGLDLRNVAAGKYTLICLPLKIEAGDGSPARAVLIESSEAWC
ncbi:MAG: cyclase family protein [Armatimonadota bacterium]|nr:cyclase family protein [Armatimonadota bacterium]